VIVLGAGQDTMFFRLKTSHPEWLEDTLYVELDFPAVTRSKVRLCRRQKSIAECLGPTVKTNEMEMMTKGYALLACDLRDLAAVRSKFQFANVDPQLPTFVSIDGRVCLYHLTLYLLFRFFPNAFYAIWSQVRQRTS
jgi:hypothetical protein